MSALATIVGSLGELSESELKQLYLMVGVRLGNPDVPPSSKGGGGRTGKTGKTGPSSGKTAKKGGTSSKGNPQRKSQWANHPLYQEYSRLKKVVENQAKEAKSSFNSVDTAESRAYQQAFIHWMEAKSSFRDHRDGPEEQSKTAKVDDEESSEDEEEEPVRPPPSASRGAMPTRPQPIPAAAGANAQAKSAGSSNAGSPPKAGNASIKGKEKVNPK